MSTTADPIRPRRGHLKITAAVVSFALTFIGVVWLFTLSRTSFEHNSELAAITRGNANLIKAIVENVRHNMLSMDDILLVIKDEYEERGVVRQDIIDRIKNVRAIPLIQLSVIDERGDIIASSLPALNGANVGDGEYFRYFAENHDNRPYFSRPTIDKVTNNWIFHLSRRLSKPDGSFAGAVDIGVDPAYFSRFYSQINLGRTYAIGLVGRDGYIRVRQAGDRTDIGTDVRRASLLAHVQQAPAGSFVATAAIDHQRRIFTYQALADYPLVVAVTVQEAEALADYYQRRREYYLTAAAVTLLVIGFSGLLVRMVAQKAKAEEDLRLANEQLEARVARRTEELADANQELLRLSVLDGLTGIANRRYFDQYLEREWLGAIRRGKPLALIIADIDLFKAYNDTYGHQLGDDCLRVVAATLGESVKRATDLVARYGGEEFAIILPDTDATGALTTAEELRARIEALAIEHQSAPLGHVTISLGVAAAVPRPGQPYQDLVAMADSALYKAKRAGRNRVERDGAPA